MATKNFLLALVIGGVLGGCATSGERVGVQAQDLRKPSHFVTEQVIGDMDFPTLQRNLFQHRAECGSAPRFVMHEGETSYASLIETADLPDSYENVVLFDLVQYPDNWRSPPRVAVQAYSYYQNDDVLKRVEQMLNSVRSPGKCAPEETTG